MFAHFNEDMISEVDDNEELSLRKNELFEIRQTIYAKLRNGKNTFLIMKMFKRKVERFLKKFRAELSYDEEKNWREKVIITEKAVIRNRNELKAANHSRKGEILASTVKEMIDEIKEELESIKKFNKKLVHAMDENIAGKVSKVMKAKIDEVNDLKGYKNDDERGSDVKNMVDKKDVIEDEDEDSVSKTFNNEADGDMVEKCTKSEIESKCENDKNIDEKLAPSKKEIALQTIAHISSHFL